MVAILSKENVLDSFDRLADSALFTGIGYLCGRVVNHIIHIRNISIIPKPAYLDLTPVTISCALFILIDQVAQYILKEKLGNDAKRLSVSSCRLLFSFCVSVLSIKPFYPTQFPIQGMAVVMGIALIARSLFAIHLNQFNNRL